MTELNGKVALITGGSRGIGAATAKRLAADGAAVAVTYAHAEDQARQVQKQIETRGGRATVVHADLRQAEGAARAVEETVQLLGRLDVLVNNAGFLAYGPLESITAEHLDDVLAVDVRSIVLAAQAAVRHLPRGGRIINVGSCFNGRVPGGNFVLQATAKSALIGFTKALGRELGPRGITVNTIDPGPVDTDINPADGESADFQRGLTALGHYGEASDIASAVAYLAGPGGRFVTGAALAVDGGYTI
jgi:NAD(P)-dependent dehydrogenase (short-subunit alcohol dehydrogenase family)